MREFLLSAYANFVDWSKDLEYKTISCRCEARFIEKKSEFIGYLCPVSTEDEAVSFINEIRAMHRKATHNCYAYILRENSTARHSDDGEPSGTAGVPIYEVLRKEELTDIVCVVTRYFGGVLLGAGGLVRAYTRGAKDAVDCAEIKIMALAARMKISLDYPLYGRLPQILAEFGTKTEDENFGQNVEITVWVRTELAEPLRDKLTDTCSGNVNVEITAEEWYNFA